MKIGIITFYNCDNYGAELQAYALQKKLTLLGYDAELLNMEKEAHNPSARTIFNAIKNRYKQYGLLGGTKSSYILIRSKLLGKKAARDNTDKAKAKHRLFRDFFHHYTVHSERYYTLEELRHADRLPYDVIIAGSDQIWNYMQTDYLDVFFMMFANSWGAKKVSYAASFSVSTIPVSMKQMYRRYLNNVDFISVRESDAVDIVRDCSGRKAELVLDPTLLIHRQQWIDWVGNPEYMHGNKKYVVIYTLSGSRYIYNLAKTIAKKLDAEVLNIKNDYLRIKGDEGITHLYDVGPREFISLFSKASYVITDSFHGTAFSINFNIPFTTLLNPVSNINSRALSILNLTRLMDRMIYDDGSNKEPETLSVDFTLANGIINDYREKSIKFITESLKLV